MAPQKLHLGVLCASWWGLLSRLGKRRLRGGRVYTAPQSPRKMGRGTCRAPSLLSRQRCAEGASWKDSRAPEDRSACCHGNPAERPVGGEVDGGVGRGEVEARLGGAAVVVRGQCMSSNLFPQREMPLICPDVHGDLRAQLRQDSLLARSPILLSLQRLAQGGEAASEKAAWRKGHQIPSAVSTRVRVAKKEMNSDQRVGWSVVSEMQTPCFLSLGQIRAIGRATVYLVVCTGLGQSTQKGGRAEG